jgi:hypothetical protein
MTPGFEAIPEAVASDIDQALHHGAKIQAIQYYRNATGAALRDAKRALEDRAAQIGATRSIARVSWKGLLFQIAVAIALGIVLFLLREQRH